MSAEGQRVVKLLKAVLECDAGMKQGVVYYRNAIAAGDPVHALALLKRAARLPYQRYARIQDLIQRYGGAANVNAWLASVNGPTLGQLQTILQPLMDYSDLLRDRYLNQGWTEDQIATDIEATRESADLEELPVPSGYVDDM